MTCVRPFNVAELCSLDVDFGISFNCLFFNFIPNMLAFSVTIRPYKKSLSIFCFICDIVGDVLLVLLAISVKS